jgi:hypothetical protein
MTEQQSPMRWAAVSFALVDSLIGVLQETGVLTEADRAKISERALQALRNSPNVEVQGAEFLFHELRNRPQPR